MWRYEHTAQTPLPPEAVWRVLADIDDWASWDTSMADIRLLGPFAVGSQIAMTPHGQEPIRSTIVEIDRNRRYADETTFGGVTLRFSHTLTPLESGGTRVVHALTIDGPTAEATGPDLGAQITEDFPDAMAALLSRAAELAAMTRFPDGPADSPGFLLWHITLRWQRTITAALAPFELTHVQFVLLACTWWLNEQDQTPNQLTVAAQAGTDVKMTSQVLRKLEERGLVRRQTDTRDTRAKTLRVTAKGAKLARETVTVVERIDAEFFEPVTPTVLTRTLRQLAHLD